MSSDNEGMTAGDGGGGPAIRTGAAMAMAGETLSLGAAVAAFRAAGEDTRLRLLHLLSFGELSIKDLTAIVGHSQPRISRHLKLLDEAGLVRRHREGNWVYCRLVDDGALGALARAMLDRLRAGDASLAADFARLSALKRDRAAAAERFFNKIADEWDRARTLQIGEAEVERAITRLVGRRRYRTMLDLGTGTGRMLELFAAKIDHGTGIDISHTMLAHARAKLDGAGLAHCQVRHGDITSLSQDAGSADLVVLHQVLHYFDDPLPVLREAARVLADNGDFVIVDFAPHSVEFLRDEHAHRRLGFAREQIEEWLGQTGLSLARAVDLSHAGGAASPGLTVSLWLAGKARDAAGEIAA